LDPTKVVGLGFAGIHDFGVRTRHGDHRLTFSPIGKTNNTMLRLDGRDVPIGRLNNYVVQDFPSEGTIEAPDAEKRGGLVNKQMGHLKDQDEYTTIGQFRDIRVTQKTAYEYGETSRRRDTIRLTYTLQNTGATDHAVGLRVLLDTFIGENDGVPFLVPGREGVVTTPLVLTGDDVPDTIHALEKPDLTDATMTVVKLRFGGNDGERPSKVVICHWPGERGSATWDVNVTNPIGEDSAVAVYFDPKPLRPLEARTFGFTYGLGDLANRESTNDRLRILATAPNAGGPCRIQAIVQRPRAGQKVRLTLPAELTLAAGETAEKPLTVPARYSVTQESWVVKVAPAASGMVRVKVRLEPDGVDESKELVIQTRDPAVRLVVSKGEVRAGGQLRVAANVLNATPGLKVRLELPPGMALGAGEADATKDLPAGPAPQVSWVVRLLPTCPARVEVASRLLPGAAAVPLAVDVQPAIPRLVVPPVEGAKAGRPFWITAQLVPPKAGLTAQLTLPPGLRLAAGHAAAKPLEDKGEFGLAQWLVVADAAGPAEVSVTVPGLEAKQVRIAVDRGSVVGN
jgi:hypothetical protein